MKNGNIVQQIEFSKIKPNPHNPRVIKDFKFKQLVQSIKDFPEMLKLRPIIVDENNIIIGGNMRYRAGIEAGLKKIWIFQVNNLSKKKKEEFVIKDNVNFGEWDWDILSNKWKTTQLNDWGLDVWQNTDDVVELVNKGDENSEWIGMPDFESTEQGIKIIITFETEEEREKYAKKNNMKFSLKAKKAWSTFYPFKETMDLKHLKYE